MSTPPRSVFEQPIAATLSHDEPPAPVERPSDDRRFFGHPRGLSTLFFTEMWERFSFYGIRPLLILFMTAALASGGFGFERSTASAIVGIYAACVYLASLPGGWVADRWLGLQRSIWWGGVLIAAGHISIALSVVFESGLQHFADRPEGFYALPDAERRFLMTVPVAWDDTRLIDGFPGKRVVIARRKGAAWYIGGLNGEDQPQTLKLSFDFLPPGAYHLELIRDGATGKEFTTQTVAVTKGSIVKVNCLPRGGFGATLVPAQHPGR